jgi:hypothetical protein
VLLRPVKDRANKEDLGKDAAQESVRP